MGEMNLGTSEIIEHLKNGATLQRKFGSSEAQLDIPNKGIVTVPTDIVDSLVDQQQIVEEAGGKYKLKS